MKAPVFVVVPAEPSVVDVRVAGMLFAIMSALASPSGFARDLGVATTMRDETIVIYHGAPDQRRQELRRALTSGADLPQAPAGSERRRLSPEERDALNLELRRAMRDAYRQRAVSAP